MAVLNSTQHTRTTNALIVQLHRRLLRNMLRQEPMQQFQIISWCFLSIFPVALACWGLAFDANLLVIVSAAGVLGLWILQATMPAPEAQIDPGVFRCLPLRSQDISKGLVLTEVWQSRGIIACVASIATLITGSITLINNGHGLVVLAYVPGIVLSYATAMLGNAWLRALGSNSADNENSSVLRVLVGVVFLLGLLFVLLRDPVAIYDAIIANNWLTTVALLTPFGASVGPAFLLMQGKYLAAAGVALLAVLYFYGLWRLNLRSTAHSLAPADPQKRQAHAAGTQRLLMPGLPYNAFTASYSRALRYFWRDNRQRYLSCTIMVMANGFALLAYFTGQTTQYGIGFCFSILFFAQYSANIYGLIGPGLASVLVSPTRMRRDLLAVSSAWTTITALCSLIYCAVAILLSGWNLVWLMAVTNLPAIWAIFGLASSWVSILLPNPASAPGTNPMRDRTNSGFGALLSLLLIWLCYLSLLPGFIISLVGLSQVENSNAAFSSNYALWGGILLNWVAAALMWAILWRFIARRADHRGPEIFAKVRHWL